MRRGTGWRSTTAAIAKTWSCSSISVRGIRTRRQASGRTEAALSNLEIGEVPVGTRADPQAYGPFGGRQFQVFHHQAGLGSAVYIEAGRGAGNFNFHFCPGS